MARGTSLNELVRMVRQEAGQSTNAALGQNTVESLKHKIRRQQEVLWREHEWTHLRVERDISLQAGDRYYNFPSDLSNSHRVDAVGVFYEGEWRPVDFGITLGHYNTLDPAADERQDPVQVWDLYEDSQLEVWPLPESNGSLLRLRGTRNLRPLVDNNDLADLDDQLIATFVAAEIVARQNQRDGQALLSVAQSMLARLKGHGSYARTFPKANAARYRNGEVLIERPRPLYGKKV